MVIDLYTTKNKYDLILADPPWKQRKGGIRSVRPKQGRALDYPTLNMEDIKQHLILADKMTGNQAILFLWTIDKFLFTAQEMAESLGYKLHARMIWNKVTGIPAAFTVRYGHEYLLYMYKGNLLPVDSSARGKIHTVFTEQAKKHSQKPEIAYQIIETLYPTTKKLEMYARKARDGWDCWGNEV